MTFSSAAIATARRNVAQRTGRFLNGLERAGRPPNRRELYYLREAFQKLEAGQYPEAEDAMLKAERIAPVPAAPAVPDNDAVSIDDLRAELSRILQGSLP
jgi:hypothetical protein